MATLAHVNDDHAPRSSYELADDIRRNEEELARLTEEATGPTPSAGVTHGQVGFMANLLILREEFYRQVEKERNQAMETNEMGLAETAESYQYGDREEQRLELRSGGDRVAVIDIADPTWKPYLQETGFASEEEAREYARQFVRDYRGAEAEHQEAGAEWLAEENRIETDADFDHEAADEQDGQRLAEMRKLSQDPSHPLYGLVSSNAAAFDQKFGNNAVEFLNGGAQVAYQGTDATEAARVFAGEHQKTTYNLITTNAAGLEEGGTIQAENLTEATREAWRLVAKEGPTVKAARLEWDGGNKGYETALDANAPTYDDGPQVLHFYDANTQIDRPPGIVLEQEAQSQNGHRYQPSTAALLDKASVLADQAENPTGVADADATMIEMSSLGRTLSATANGQSPDVSGVLYDTADDIDPETLRILTADTPQDRREDLARKADLYAASVGAVPDSSLGVAVQKFAGDVRKGATAIDMTQWFEPQPGVSLESSERLAATTHQRVMDGMKPLLEEARSMGIQIDAGSVKVAQKNQIAEAISVSGANVGF